MDDRLYRMYDKIDEQEQSLIEAKAKKQSIESEKVTGDNKILIYFDKCYSLMNEEERRKLMESLIEEIDLRRAPAKRTVAEVDHLPSADHREGYENIRSEI